MHTRARGSDPSWGAHSSLVSGGESGVSSLAITLISKESTSSLQSKIIVNHGKTNRKHAVTQVKIEKKEKAMAALRLLPAALAAGEDSVLVH